MTAPILALMLHVAGHSAAPGCIRAVDHARRSGARLSTLPARLAVCARVHRAALRHRVDPALVVALAWAESRLEDGRTSRAGAQGPLQVVPRWRCPGGQADGCDLVDAGVRALAGLIERHGAVRGVCHYAAGNRCTVRALRYAGGVVSLAERLALKEPGT